MPGEDDSRKVIESLPLEQQRAMMESATAIAAAAAAALLPEGFSIESQIVSEEEPAIAGWFYSHHPIGPFRSRFRVVRQ